MRKPHSFSCQPSAEVRCLRETVQPAQPLELAASVFASWFDSGSSCYDSYWWQWWTGLSCKRLSSSMCPLRSLVTLLGKLSHTRPHQEGNGRRFRGTFSTLFVLLSQRPRSFAYFLCHSATFWVPLPRFFYLKVPFFGLLTHIQEAVQVWQTLSSAGARWRISCYRRHCRRLIVFGTGTFREAIFACNFWKLSFQQMFLPVPVE